MPLNTKITLRFNDSEIAAVTEYADHHELSLSAAIRRLLRIALTQTQFGKAGIRGQPR
jgi:hypothetical protein